MDIHQVVLDDEAQQEVKEEFYQDQEDLCSSFVSSKASEAVGGGNHLVE